MLALPPQLSADDPLWIKIMISVVCLSLVAIAYREHRTSVSQRGMWSGPNSTMRGSRMSGILKALGVGLALLIGDPLLNEETVSICHSVEKTDQILPEKRE